MFGCVTIKRKQRRHDDLAEIPCQISAGLRILALSIAATGTAAATEIPSFNQLVGEGVLPPMADRMPETPAIEDFRFDWQSLGAHGGQATLLMSRAKDIRIMTVYGGYARLIGYTPEFELQPDILRRVDVVDNKTFTFHLRPGHRWSDGHPSRQKTSGFGGRMSPITISLAQRDRLTFFSRTGANLLFGLSTSTRCSIPGRYQTRHFCPH